MTIDERKKEHQDQLVKLRDHLKAVEAEHATTVRNIDRFEGALLGLEQIEKDLAEAEAAKE